MQILNICLIVCFVTDIVVEYYSHCFLKLKPSNGYFEQNMAKKLKVFF